MYQGKRRIMNPERHEEYRSQAISYRGGAIFNAFIDLEDIINKSVFAKTYMNHSQSWFSQKLNECPVGGAKKEFTASELLGRGDIGPLPYFFCLSEPRT